MELLQTVPYEDFTRSRRSLKTYLQYFKIFFHTRFRLKYVYDETKKN